MFAAWLGRTFSVIEALLFPAAILIVIAAMAIGLGLVALIGMFRGK